MKFRFNKIIETTAFFYIVMELIEGGEIYEKIVENVKLDEQFASLIFCQIVDAVEHCHKNNVVHRDLKPENIMLTKDNIVKIIDFGLSNVIVANKLMKTSCGTKCYSAPETMANKEYSPLPTDIWSLGIILFVMVCGHLPFDVSK